MSRKPSNNKKGKKERGEVPAIVKYGKRRYSGPKKKLTVKEGQKQTDEIRLNKFIAQSGICSRREADNLIAVGAITVNGQVVTELGTKVLPTDKVQYEGQTIRNEKKVYFLLNKPKNYITTLDDPFKRRTILDIMKNACKERIYPVGRLDRNTTGVILLTNDGDLSKKLTHPKHGVKKIYHVFLTKAFSQDHFNQLQEGITLEDGFVKPDELAWVKKDSKFEVGIEIHSGKNRIVRRIFEHLGYEVKKLDRVYFAGLTKKNLPRGEYRALEEKEVNMLRMLG
jgi:23S rRNA pseudouridine2605 synthase